MVVEAAVEWDSAPDHELGAGRHGHVDLVAPEAPTRTLSGPALQLLGAQLPQPRRRQISEPQEPRGGLAQ
eukprot:9126542-Pyramimonas_sp.AAC.1